MIKGKIKGMANERKARKILEGSGYYVIPSKGSHGLWDLVGLWDKSYTIEFTGMECKRAILLIQVKTNRKPSKSELSFLGNAVPRLTERGLVTKELWIFRDRQNQPEIITIK